MTVFGGAIRVRGGDVGRTPMRRAWAGTLPCEGIERRWLATSQKKSHQQSPTILAPSSQTTSLQNYKKNKTKQKNQLLRPCIYYSKISQLLVSVALGFLTYIHKWVALNSRRIATLLFSIPARLQLPLLMKLSGLPCGLTVFETGYFCLDFLIFRLNHILLPLFQGSYAKLGDSET